MIEKLTYQDIETIFLVGFALVFYFLERLSPKHRDLDVRTFIKEDIAAFVMLVVGVAVFRLIVRAIYLQINLTNYLYWTAAENWSFPVKVMLAHLISDFILYWIHRGMHNNKFLWQTHKWHHSAESLYRLSGSALFQISSLTPT